MTVDDIIAWQAVLLTVKPVSGGRDMSLPEDNAPDDEKEG